MARPQVRDIAPANPIRPVAQPVDTYVRPADPGRSPLHDLAEGIAAFDSGLAGWLSKRQQEQKDADAVRGQAAFNQNNQVGWSEAVKQGLVPAHASPVFMESYKKAQGNLEGIRLRERFNLEYANWEHRNSGDPELFQEFLSTFISNNISSDDPYVLAGLNPHIQALTDNAYSTYGTDLANTTYNNSVNTRAAIAGDTIDHASIQGLVYEDGTDYGGLMSDLLAQREEALNSGVRMADYDKELVNAIAAKAIEHGDPALLDLLDEVIPGYDVALSSLPDFRDVKANTIGKLETRARQNMIDADRRQQKEDEDNHNRVVLWVVNHLAEDPMGEIPEEVYKTWERYDPEARTKAIAIQRSLLDGQRVEDPQVLLHIERAIQGGATVQDILEMAETGLISDVSTLRTALDRVETRQRSIREGHGILNTPTANRYKTTIRERLADMGLDDPFAPDGLTDEAIEATREFEQILLEWEADNPNATIIERERFINEAADLILSRVVEQDDSFNRQYVSASDAEEMRRNTPPENPATRQPNEAPGQRAGERIGQEGGRAYNASQFDEQTIQTFGQDAPPNVSTMDDATRAAVEERARTRGITPEEYSMQIWQFVREQLGLPSEAPSVPTQGSTPQDSVQTENHSPLLNLIGEAEGTDQGRGYNETFGYGRYTGGDIELTDMTLDEVAGVQSRMLDDPDNRHRSSAVGRYQITGQTMDYLRNKLNLTGNEKFTPELQDRMAVALLRRRGLDKWLQGDITIAQFKDNLSKEWASLPNSVGLGHYANQQDNVVTAETAREAIKQLISQPGIPGSDVVRLGYAQETSDIRTGIGAAIDEALKPRTATPMSVAERYLGYREGNSQEAQTLSAFFKQAGGQNVNPTTTAWCAAFVNAVLGEMDLGGTGSLAARSFLNYGTPVNDPARGDVVVFWRESPSSWKGHVGFFDSIVTRNGKQFVRVLGGNQSNKVSYAEYPVERLLGYRRPENMDNVI